MAACNKDRRLRVNLRGKEHPNWKGSDAAEGSKYGRTYTVYPYGNACELCGVSANEKRIVRHHKDRDIENPDTTNIQYLCEKGHKKEHGSYQVKITHCPKGHEYTEENTYLSGKGKGRTCKTCNREYRKNRWRRIYGKGPFLPETTTGSFV